VGLMDIETRNSRNQRTAEMSAGVKGRITKRKRVAWWEGVESRSIQWAEKLLLGGTGDLSGDCVPLGKSRTR